MKIQINSPHIPMTGPFEEHVEERTEEVLKPFAQWLTRVEVHFQDLNAQKAGVDKRCLLEARPRGRDPITAEGVAEDLRAAFHLALDRLKRALEHRLGRRAEHRGTS